MGRKSGVKGEGREIRGGPRRRSYREINRRVETELCMMRSFLHWTKIGKW
jgi:hypothetical protein